MHDIQRFWYTYGYDFGIHTGTMKFGISGVLGTAVSSCPTPTAAWSLCWQFDTKRARPVFEQCKRDKCRCNLHHEDVSVKPSQFHAHSFSSALSIPMLLSPLIPLSVLLITQTPAQTQARPQAHCPTHNNNNHPPKANNHPPSSPRYPPPATARAIQSSS